MDETDDILETVRVEQRKYRRFNLRCPVLISTSFENSLREVEGITINVSLGGLLLEAPSLASRNNTARFIMSVKSPPVTHPIVLAGTGKIVRVVRHGTGCVIAIQCASPLAEMDEDSAVPATEV